MKVSYFHHAHPADPKTYKRDKPVWTWHQVLIDSTSASPDEANKVMADKVDTLTFGSWAPMEAFHEAPLRKHLVLLKKEMLLEVELPPTDRTRTEMLDKRHTPVWIGEVVHMLGYFILVRWCGAKVSDGLFWIHAANPAIHNVGYVAKTRTRKENRGVVLCPPYAIMDNNTTDQWVEYAVSRVTGRLTPSDSFEERGREIYANKFNIYYRVETIHEDESSTLVPAQVKRVLGRRVLLEYSKPDIDKADMIVKANMWKDMNDDLIYPIGFAETMGLRMTANKKYREHVANIATAIKEGKEFAPYDRFDATREKIYQWRKNENATATWEVDMVCEMIDRLDECQNIMKAARVLKILPDGYLQLGPEGADILNDSFYIHQTTAILFPVGYAKTHNITLQGPKGDNEEAFDWDSFLKRTNYTPAPKNFFHEATEENVPFKVGMRLEAIDQNEKMLCPATVKAIKGRLVLVAFDGWEDDFDQLYDYRSNELLPCGWGEMIGYALQEPTRNVATEIHAEEVADDDDDDE